MPEIRADPEGHLDAVAGIVRCAEGHYFRDSVVVPYHLGIVLIAAAGHNNGPSGLNGERFALLLRDQAQDISGIRILDQVFRGRGINNFDLSFFHCRLKNLPEALPAPPARGCEIGFG